MCGAGTAGAMRGTAAYVACNIQDALRSRNISALPGYMADPFTIGYYQSEGAVMSPLEFLDLLPSIYDYNSIDSTSSMSFTADRGLFPAMDGMPLESMFGPDVDIILVVYSQGWGKDGRGGSLLFFTQDEQGNIFWHGMVYSGNNFYQ